MENNIIILRTPHKIPKGFFNPARIPSTGRYPDCVKPTNSAGDMIISQDELNSGKYFVKDTDVIEVWDGKVFNLNDEIERAQWEAIEHHKLIAKNRFERDDKGNLIIDGNSAKYGVAEWYVETPGLEAQNKNLIRRKKIQAQTYILEDNPEDRLMKAKVLGKVMRNVHESDVEDYLMQEAEKNPDKIINLYTGGDMKLRILFFKAKDAKVIVMKDKMWCYGDTYLGASEDAVIMWMKQVANKKILKIIEQEVYPEMFEQPKK